MQMETNAAVSEQQTLVLKRLI